MCERMSTASMSRVPRDVAILISEIVPDVARPQSSLSQHEHAPAQVPPSVREVLASITLV